MRIKKKSKVGTARIFISQKRAMQKLQLSLKDFRRLCILKGIYPREPNHIKKANRGSTQTKIFYHIKDINYLSSEPLINKFREQKVFFRRLTTAKKKKNLEKQKNMLLKKPVFVLDNLVRERYPTFQSAIQDLDDALCLCFAFSALTQSKVARYFVISECKRLTIEFMHYVIESNSLRKVFISIKGIYYQAEILGEKITWLVGHERSVSKAQEIDLSVMATFVDFYITMLSFVNFRLYKLLGLYYPPKLNELKDPNDYFNENVEEEMDKIYCLATPITKKKVVDEEEVNIDSFDNDQNKNNENVLEKLKNAESFRNLFKNFKFFINREVPKDPLTFIIRSCNGTVSWENCPNNLYDESSSVITHHIIDRNIENFNVNRIYIQPQWIFDSFNARRLLSTSKYAPGVVLPPHLSPFVEENIGDYVPLEKFDQLKESGKDISQFINNAENEIENIKKNNLKTQKKKKPLKQKNKKPCMQVKVGQISKENREKELEEQRKNLKLREMMLPKKYRRVYKKIKFGEKRKIKEVKQLYQKRLKTA